MEVLKCWGKESERSLSDYICVSHLKRQTMCRLMATVHKCVLVHGADNAVRALIEPFRPFQDEPLTVFDLCAFEGLQRWGGVQRPSKGASHFGSLLSQGPFRVKALHPDLGTC